ncbi:MAG: hypothetical protein H7836_13605 [Magnetococcus sp. YQC-3]
MTRQIPFQVHALHFAPPEAREQLDSRGLLCDFELFEHILHLRADDPPWYREQCAVERALGLDALRPLHLFKVPLDDPAVVRALQEERGIDIREVDLAALAEIAQMQILYGRGLSFKGLAPPQRLLSIPYLSRGSAKIGVDRLHANGWQPAIYALEILVLIDHPERIPYTDRTARTIHPVRAERLLHPIRTEHPQNVLIGGRTRGTLFFTAACMVAALVGSLLAWFAQSSNMAVLALACALLAALPWIDHSDRYFVGLSGNNWLLRLSDEIWTVPGTAIQSIESMDPAHPEQDRQGFRLLLQNGEEIVVSFRHSGLLADQIRDFLQQHAAAIGGRIHWRSPQPQPRTPEYPEIIFLSPLAAGSDWPHRDGSPVAAIRCFNPTPYPWLIGVQPELRQLEDRDASLPHYSSRGQGGVVEPGGWKSFAPYPGWPPKDGYRIWFEVSLHNRDHDWLLYHYYDLERDDRERRVLPDGAEGWMFQPVRIRDSKDPLPARTYPTPEPPIAVRVGNPAEEEFRILGFADRETARKYARRRHRANVEANLHPQWLDPDDIPVDTHGHVILPLEELQRRASYGGEWAYVEGEGDSWEIRRAEMDHLLANPAISEETDYEGMEEALGLVEWTIFSPAGSPSLQQELARNKRLQDWFCSPYWMQLIRRGLRNAFFVWENRYILMPPGPFASDAGDMVYYTLRDTGEDEDVWFLGLVTVGVPIDRDLNPTGMPVPCIVPSTPPAG